MGSYSTLDLTLLGIGGTVGSGIFVTTSLVARSYAGPSVVLSWLVAGLAASLNALSYCELSFIGSSGSSYEYAKILGHGNYFATIAASCLSLEYGVSGVAVARSWGDKVVMYMRLLGVDVPRLVYNPRLPSISVLGFLLQLYCTLLLLHGVDPGRRTTNLFTVFKMLLIAFIIVLGFYFFNTDNLSGGLAPYGGLGILRGSSLSFFGYVGFDEVCSFASEAKRPDQLHLALLYTVSSVTAMCALASVALVGMQRYGDINVESGFPSAFRANGCAWAFHVVSLGELFSLPVVTLVSFLAQPRLQCQLAKDGLLPAIFAKTDSKGNLSHSIFITGTLLSLAALVVPFTYLNDMISSGILVSFTLTNCSLIVHRLGDSCQTLLVRFMVASLLSAVLLSLMTSHSSGSAVVALALLLAPCSCALCCFAFQLHSSFEELPLAEAAKRPYFRVPCVPALPLLACAVNCVLAAQLPATANITALAYLAAASLAHLLTRRPPLSGATEGDARYTSVADVEMVEVSLSPLQERDRGHNTDNGDSDDGDDGSNDNKLDEISLGE